MRHSAASMTANKDCFYAATNSPGLTHFGLLPEPEGRSASFFTSAIVNLVVLALVLIISLTAKHVIVESKFEQTELIIPKISLPRKKS